MELTRIEQSVNLTTEHIIRGMPNSMVDCPVAYSLLDDVITINGSEVIGVEVGQATVELWTRDGTEYLAQLPYDIKMWIDAFDTGAPDYEYEPDAADVTDFVSDRNKDLMERRMKEFLPVKFDLVFHAANIGDEPSF